MTLMASSPPTMTLKYFSSKLYKIRVRLLDSLDQIAKAFTTQTLGASGEQFDQLSRSVGSWVKGLIESVNASDEKYILDRFLGWAAVHPAHPLDPPLQLYYTCENLCTL